MPAPVSRAGESFRVGEAAVPRGRRERLELKVARLFTGEWLSLPVTVVCGAEPGPRLWMNAALHGDELNGMETIRRVVSDLDPARLRGVVMAVPIVNVFGFVQKNRYLPDRRDLNRSFPGSPRGSLAGRLAHLFLQEVVRRCQYGIDLHTGSLDRTNLPQVRADLSDPETRRLAEAFGAPMMIKAALRSGSLRAQAHKMRVPLLVFEGGEPERFNEPVIRTGVAGVRRVLAELGMHPAPSGKPPPPSFEAIGSRWVRAGRSGILRLQVELGERVEKGQVLGWIGGALASDGHRVRAPFQGLVIGHTNSPLVYQGDALVHVAHGRGKPAGSGRPEPGRGPDAA